MIVHNLTIRLARLHQRIGLHGLLGVCLIVAATLQFGFAWLRKEDIPKTLVNREVEPNPKGVQVQPLVTQLFSQLTLPSTDKVPRLLARLQHNADEHGLGWPGAEYRMRPATKDAPTNLEVRCTLNGSYVAIRSFVKAILLDIPTLTLHEFSLTRATPETTKIEAKLVIVIYFGKALNAREAEL